MDTEGGNRLLEALPYVERLVLRPNLEFQRLGSRQQLYAPDRPIDAVYFPVSGVVSMVAHADGDSVVEVATLGNEGLVGLPLFLGIDASPLETFAQIEGDAYRMEAKAFCDSLERLPALRALLQRYTQALFVQVTQNAACNGSHSVAQRCARWLLMTHDRIGCETFSLRREFLGQMLTATLLLVEEAVGGLRDRGLLTYEGDIVTILDRAGLEEAACGCYRLIKREYERLLR